MKKYYKSVAFVKNTVEKECRILSEAQKQIDSSAKRLTDVGTKLYKQFCGFAVRNTELYDEDFIERLKISKYAIKSVGVVATKKAIRIKIEYETIGVKFVMIPFLFLEDELAYKAARVRRNSFGKGATMKDVEKHYDGKIEKLRQEVLKLEQEKKSMTFDEKDWR